MSETSAGAILYTKDDDRIYYLIIKDFHNNYGFPKGHLEKDETLCQAATREIKEETSLSVDNHEYVFSIPNLYVYSGMTIHTIDMFFIVRVDANVEPKADDDVARLQWMPIADVDYRQFGLHSISQGVRRFVESFSKNNSLTI